MNPFLTVRGPRPETWWAVCNLCGQTSSPRFRSGEDAGDWEHDCHTEADDDGKVTLTVEYTLDDPPKITWTGSLTGPRVNEIRSALMDMNSWWLYRGEHASWRDTVRAGWERRRRAATERAMAEFTRALERPFVCPGCSRGCKSVGGLRTHMRACHRIDLAKLRAGGYDAAMVPGGAPTPGDAG